MRTDAVPGSVDAIVVAWRSSDVIRACVEALRDDEAVGQIVVVNNSQEDPLDSAILGIDRLRLLEPSRNLGYGSAVNLAHKYVAGPYVALVNPDAFQTDNTVSHLVEFLQRNPHVGIAGPRMVHLDGSLYQNSQRDLSLQRMVGGTFHPKLGLQRTPEEHLVAHATDYVIASFAVARSDALDMVGWFDESIFMFGEDLDLCRRLRLHGWEVWYAPVGTVEHMSGHSWRQDLARNTQLLREARYRELRKAQGRGSAYTYRALSASASAFRRIMKPFRRTQGA